MKYLNYVTATSIIALSLLAATPALANTGAKVDAGMNFGLRFAPIIRFADEYKGNYKSFPRTASTTAGTVASVNGSTFVVDPIRSGEATTTVVTDSSTVFKENGSATTSAALTTGARVIVVGTTTATSTSGNTVEASLVIILTKFANFCEHMMGIK